MARLILIAVFVTLVACGGAEDSVPVSGTASATTDVLPETVPSSTEPESVRSGEVPIGEEYEPPDGWIVREQLSVRGLMLARDGVTIETAFTGGVDGEPDDPCVRNYELVHREAADSVEVALFELAASDPGDISAGQVCPAVGHPWRLEVALAKPLAHRGVADDLTGEPAPLVDLSAVLLPSMTPEGFTKGDLRVALSDPQLTQFYEADAGNGFIEVSSAPVSDAWNLDWVRGRDLVRVEDKNLRTLGGIEVTSLEDGATTLAWEEAGRLYLVHGYLVDVGELQAIVDTMT